jgi:hypothetical protein
MSFPLYAFVRGDSAVILVIARAGQTVAQVTREVQSAAAVRVPIQATARLCLGDRRLDPDATIEESGLRPLDRVDVVLGDT